LINQARGKTVLPLYSLYRK